MPSPRSALLWVLTALAVPVLAQNEPIFDIDPTVFPSITPSENLVWRDCYFGYYKCARMIVPARIVDPYKPQEFPPANCGHNKATVQLAIVKLPYVPSGNDPPRRGAIHVALGGWSQSSTNFLVRFGLYYTPLTLGYDLIAIDYRGFGYSTPRYSCFETENERRQWALSEPQLLGADANALAVRSARARDLADRCKRNGGDVGRYMGIYPSAVDHYTVMKADGRSTLSFWGVSAGGHVAQTFAMLYPSAVDRFFLDAPAPSDLAYDITTAQPDQVKDAEKALDAFFYTCLAAGRSKCEFVTTSTTTQQMRNRYAAIDARLKTTPIAVAGNPRKFDWSALHLFLNVALNGPGAGFPLLAGVLAEAETGVAGRRITQVMTSVVYQAPAAPAYPPLDEEPPLEGVVSGVCLDERNHLASDADFSRYFDTMTTAAPTVAPIFAEWRLVCSKWSIKPINKFPGNPGRGAQTNGTFLVVNAVADPASSLDGARSTAAKYVTSAVVKNVAAGHTTFSAPSSCVYNKMFALYRFGQLPDSNSRTCQPDSPPFSKQLPVNF